MNQVHVLVNYECGRKVLGVLTDQYLLEEYLACSCEGRHKDCRRFEIRGKKCPYHKADFWTVALDEPSIIQQPKDRRDNTNVNQVHVLSNGFGEILGASTDKVLLAESIPDPLEAECQCEYKARGEVCPYRMFIDTIALDDPGLIQHFKNRIAEKSRWGSKVSPDWKRGEHR